MILLMDKDVIKKQVNLGTPSVITHSDHLMTSVVDYVTLFFPHTPALTDLSAIYSGGGDWKRDSSL